MPYAGFHNYFPDMAKRETRSLSITDPALPLPPGEYGLIEMYCDEAGYDCRRVFFYVVASFRKGPEAVIGYGWEDEGFYARWMKDADPAMLKDLKGPSLNLLSPQSELAPAILDLIENVVLKDAAYIERLKRHYRVFRDVVDGKASRQPKPAAAPTGGTVGVITSGPVPQLVPVPPAPTDPAGKDGRNDPCPCGSGRKFKKCCMGKE
jgi:hypothetical protein